MRITEEAASGFEDANPALPRLRLSATLATRPPISDERMTLNWLAIGLASRIKPLVAGEVRFPGFFDEGEVDHLLIAAIGHCLANARERPLPARSAAASTARPAVPPKA
jgi:hypothetical protein